MSKFHTDRDKSKLYDSMQARFKVSPASVAFPEFHDPRIQQTLQKLDSDQMIKSVILPRAQLMSIDNLGLSSRVKVESFEDKIPDLIGQTRHYVSRFFEAKGKKISADDLAKHQGNALLHGGICLDQKLVDCCIAGSVATTADVIRSALWTVGLESSIVSSCFVMEKTSSPLYMYADAGVIPKPSPEHLCDIAVASVKTWRKVSTEKPKVAFLSFSTKGSARHESIEDIKTAVSLFQTKFSASEVDSDGEIQFDAAVNPSIAARKCPDSPLGGRANIFIFPDLHAANIGYKITQQLAGFQAYGPLLQGLKSPIAIYRADQQSKILS